MAESFVGMGPHARSGVGSRRDPLQSIVMTAVTAMAKALAAEMEGGGEAPRKMKSHLAFQMHQRIAKMN